MYIYKITNLINNKFYIGLSTKNVQENHKYLGSGILIKRDILKYGKQNFIKEILEDNIKDLDLLKSREIYWIEKLKSHVSFGNYNLTKGGDGLFGHVHSDESKLKISHSGKGRSPWNKNKQMDEDTKLKISKSNLGRNHTEENRAKISKAQFGKTRRPLSEEHKNKISKACLGYVHTEDTKLKMRGPRSNQEIVECPYCNKTGGINAMNRWHFNNCKKDRNEI